MKKTFTLFFTIALLATALTSAQAFPTGKSNESGEYLSGTGIFHLINAGVYGGTMERDVQFSSTVLPLESSKAIVYVGVEAQPWLTFFAGMGPASHQLGTSDTDSSIQGEIGMLVNLIDHVILDPTLFEDKLRINLGGSWGVTQADWFGDDVNWQEFTAFATVSIVNDTVGNKFFNPNSIAIYGGPMFSYIQSDDIEADKEFGFMAGVEVFVSESISLDAGIRQFDGTGFEGGIHIRF